MSRRDCCVVGVAREEDVEDLRGLFSLGIIILGVVGRRVDDR